MKIRKFDNIWTMGLILCGALLLVFYFAKLFFPQWIVGVAQVPSIVRFGEYVDNHWWLYYPISMAFSYGIGYVYLCACCRTKVLNLKENIIVATEVLLFNLIDIFMPSQSFNANIFLMLLMPLAVVYLRKENNIKFMYSTTLTFVIHSIAQILSLSIRDIGLRLTHFNTATLTILLIDCYIWLFMLYLYYNYEREKTMGIANAPWYGEDLGSAIETTENVIARIKTNKFDKNDLADLANVLEVIKTEVEKNEG